MRGVRAVRQAPLIALFVLLATCRFEFQLIEPSIEVDAQTAYSSGNSVTIDYKFTADEPALRCRYAVNSAGSIVLQGVTPEFPPDTWQQLVITLEPVEGQYAINLVAQARRSEGFVDLAFLTRTVDFFLDSHDPVEPEFNPTGGLFNSTTNIALTHEEWTLPKGSDVKVYFTLDHTDPTSSSNQYIVGMPITVELSVTPTEIRAIAIDGSGRKSSVKSESYNFINIEYTTSTSYPNYPEDPNKFDTTLQDQFIYPHGYGFSNVEYAEFKDSDGTTPVSTVVMTHTATLVTVAVSLPADGSFIGNGTDTDGILWLKDASGKVLDEISVDLIP